MLFAEFEGDGHVEWIAQYASKLPSQVITHMLGLPLDDLDQLRSWSSAWVLPFIRKLEPDEDIWVAEQVVDFYNYLQAATADKRSNPGNDIITSLTQATLAGERPLTDQEIITIVDHLFIGGNETTTFAMASGLWILLREAGLHERLAGDRTRIPDFVEEVLRIESPTQGLWRAVAEDAVIDGVAIPAGSTVHLRYASANRDERVFACPADVDLDRPNAGRHMAFSLGEHHCPGAGLTRLEQTLTFEEIFDRLPNPRLSQGRNDFTHVPMFAMRSLRELHVDFDPRPRPTAEPKPKPKQRIMTRRAVDRHPRGGVPLAARTEPDDGVPGVQGGRQADAQRGFDHRHLFGRRHPGSPFTGPYAGARQG